MEELVDVGSTFLKISVALDKIASYSEFHSTGGGIGLPGRSLGLRARSVGQ